MSSLELLILVNDRPPVNRIGDDLCHSVTDPALSSDDLLLAVSPNDSPFGGQKTKLVERGGNCTRAFELF